MRRPLVTGARRANTASNRCSLSSEVIVQQRGVDADALRHIAQRHAIKAVL